MPLCDKYQRIASGTPNKSDREINSLEEWALVKMMDIPEYASHAREILYHRQIRFLISYVRPYTNKGICMEDLIMYGRIGLAQAISKYVLGCGTRFSTYSRNWVLKPVRAALHGAHFLNLPAYRHDQLQKIRGAMRKLPEHTPSEDRNREIAKISLLPETVVRELMVIHTFYPVSWDEMAVDNGVVSNTPEGEVLGMEDALQGLPDEDVQFLDLHLGLYTNPGKPINIPKLSKMLGKGIPYLEMRKRKLFDTLRGTLDIY